MTLKVLDFGIAKMLDPDEWVTLTATGAIVGTPMFIAPEQAIANKELIGPQTDLYSLGVILYAMLCGEPPFSRGGVGVLLTCHVKDPPPPLREKAPEVNRAVARLIHRCLEKEPERRPPSALHLAADFAAAVESEAVVRAEHPATRSELPLSHRHQESRDTIEDTAPHFAGTGPGLAFEVGAPDTRDTVVDLGDRDTLNLEQADQDTVIEPRSQPASVRGTTADDVRLRAASLSQRAGQGPTKAPVLIPGTGVTMSRKTAGRLAIVLGGVGILLIVLLLALAVYLLSAPAV
jgi:serine/threonine protein kinase